MNSTFTRRSSSLLRNCHEADIQPSAVMRAWGPFARRILADAAIATIPVLVGVGWMGLKTGLGCQARPRDMQNRSQARQHQFARKFARACLEAKQSALECLMKSNHENLRRLFSGIGSFAEEAAGD